MSKRSRIIILSVLSILIVICIVLGVTYSFMQANIDSSEITEVSLSSCANIILTDTGQSIDLENSYPMSRNKALQTTPYTFTVSSSCPDSTGFSIYMATLNTNTLDAGNIHYIITEHGNKNVIVEGILSDAGDGLSDFQEYELNELNNGINGTYGTIYRLYSNGIHNKEKKDYDLYLFIDGNVSNDTMGQTFNAGIAVKTFDYNFPTINNVNTNDDKYGSLTLSIDATPGDNEIVKYYYSIDDGKTFVESDFNSYTFSNLNGNQEYNFKFYVKDSEGYTSAIYSLDETTPSLTYLCGGYPLSFCITDIMYTGVDGDNNLYLHDGYGDYINSNLEAGDNSYRFSGGEYKLTALAKEAGYTKILNNEYIGSTSEIEQDNSNLINFYCFGSASTAYGCYGDGYFTTAYDEKTHYESYNDALIQAVTDGYVIENVINNYVCLGLNCIIKQDFSNLYRIIGAFEVDGDYQVKLIKNSTYGNGRWNIDNDPTWSNSNPNSYLNSEFISFLEDPEYSNFNTDLIAYHDWWVDGDTTGNSYDGTALDVYNIDSSSQTTYNSQVALMYVSDYAYAAWPAYWNTNGLMYQETNKSNFLINNMISSEFFLGFNDQRAKVLFSSGEVNSEYLNTMHNYRPAFYLVENAIIAEGNGTSTDPFIILD